MEQIQNTQRVKSSGGMGLDESHLNVRRDSVPGRGNRKCKDPGAGVSGVSGEWQGSQSGQIRVGTQEGKK